MTTPDSQTYRQIGELRGELKSLNRRMNDLRRLMIALIGISGGGLITAVASLVLQLLA